jgi:hypothetical protein
MLAEVGKHAGLPNINAELLLVSPALFRLYLTN